MITVRNLVKTIRHEVHTVEIIRDISFEIPDRQFAAIMGPSGSGKSTLLGLMAGLDWPTSGQIEIDGVDITKLNEDQMAVLRGRKLGFVFQAYHLVPTLTAIENVMLPMEMLGDERDGAFPRAEYLLKSVGLHDRERRADPSRFGVHRRWPSRRHAARDREPLGGSGGEPRFDHDRRSDADVA